MRGGPAEAVRRPVFARVFPALSRAVEAGGLATHRAHLQAWPDGSSR